MADGGESKLSNVINSITDKIKDLPAAQEVEAKPDVGRQSKRLFDRQKSVHELLGGGKGVRFPPERMLLGDKLNDVVISQTHVDHYEDLGKVADVVLWRKKRVSAAILGAATGVWLLFEWFGCHLLPVLSVSLMIALALLFVWSNAAAFLKRSPPPVPTFHISEDTAIHAATVLKEHINWLVSMVHELILGKDVKLFLKVELGLWFLSLMGKWADFLTLVYLCIVLVLTVPALYERYEDHVDSSLQRGLQQTHKLREMFQEKVLSKIPHGPLKEKKVQ